MDEVVELEAGIHASVWRFEVLGAGRNIEVSTKRAKSKLLQQKAGTTLHINRRKDTFSE